METPFSGQIFPNPISNLPKPVNKNSEYEYT